MMDFLKSISDIKRDPLNFKEALERVALYDKEKRGADSWEVNTILSQNEYDFLNIRFAKLKEVVPTILGFDYEKYKMLRLVSEMQKSNDDAIETAEKLIAEIPEELPESAKQELRDDLEKYIAKYRRRPRTLYSSGGAALCNRISHFLELFRRAYISGDVTICGDWIDLDTIVDTKVFFEWVQRNGFYIPEEVSCLLPDPTATTPTTEPDHDQQVDGYARPLPDDEPKDYIQRLKDKGVHDDEIQYRVYEYRLRRWALSQWKAHCLVNGIDDPHKGLKGAPDRDKYGKAYRDARDRHLARAGASEKSEFMPEKSEFMT